MKAIIYKHFLFSAVILTFCGLTAAQTEREQGIALYQQGKNKEAISILEKASKKFKADADVWNSLGLAYTKDEAYKKAVKAFEKAASINPQNASYQTNLAYVYFLSNKLDKAQSASTKAIKLNPQSADAYYIRGAANVWEGDNDNALKDAEQAISLNADYSQAYILKSDALLASFGRRVGNGSKPIDELYLLKQAQEVLENCLKSCQNNTQTDIQQQRLDTLQTFHKYFSKNRDAQLSQVTDASPDQTPSLPDPSITPLKILKKAPPGYTDNARQNNITGTIRLAVLFSETGRVTYTLILKGLGGGLNEQAIKAARAIKFEPAKKDGKPISQIKTVEYSFSIY